MTTLFMRFVSQLLQMGRWSCCEYSSLRSFQPIAQVNHPRCSLSKCRYSSSTSRSVVGGVPVVFFFRLVSLFVPFIFLFSCFRSPPTLCRVSFSSSCFVSATAVICSSSARIRYVFFAAFLIFLHHILQNSYVVCILCCCFFCQVCGGHVLLCSRTRYALL